MGGSASRSGLGALWTPGRNVLKLWRERISLAATGRCRDVGSGAVRCLDGLDLAGAWSSPEALEAWEEARAELASAGIPEGAGGVNPGDRRALFHLVFALRPRTVLEVGTHVGASTVHLAAALERAVVRRGANACLTTVDVVDVNTPLGPWKTAGMGRTPADTIQALAYGVRVCFVAEPVLDFAAGCPDRFDLVFLDGDHSGRAVYREVPMALRLLGPGGAILLHDYFPEGKALWQGAGVIEGPYSATERLRREGAPLRVLPLGELPWPTKLGTSRTSLALLLHEG